MFTLSMPNPDGFKVNTLEQLKEHFDVRAVVSYFYDGRLLRWLKARNLTDLAEQIEKLSRLDRDLDKKLCTIFGVKYNKVRTLPPELVEILKRLIQITDDKELLEQFTEEFLSKTAHIAFEKAELNERVKNFDKIYLVSSRFLIPLERANKTYVGIGDKVTAVMESKIPIDINALNIKFKSIRVEDHTIPPEPAPLPEPSTPDITPDISVTEHLEILTAFKEIEKAISRGYMPTEKMASLQLKLENAKDIAMLRELAVLYDEVKMPAWAKDCRDKATQFEIAVVDDTPRKKKKTPQAGPEGVIQEIETLLSKPYNGTYHIKKAIRKLINIAQERRSPRFMKRASEYYRRIREYDKADECNKKAEEFERSNAKKSTRKK